jgi:hypothetical protein
MTTTRTTFLFSVKEAHEEFGPIAPPIVTRSGVEGL